MSGSAVEFDPFRGGDVARTAPSTEPQREIMMSCVLSDAANCAYNEGVSITITGPVRPEVLENALGVIVSRHEALRMTFTRLGDEITVTDESRFALERFDFSDLETGERAARMADLWRELVSTPMSYTHGPLFRALWVRMTADSSELILLAHHAVCDGWSFWIILDELVKLTGGASPESLAPAPSFADFAESQAARAAANADADYWAKCFDPPPPVLDLPTDGPRPPSRTFAAARIDHVFGAELVKAITALAGKQKASVVNVTLAGTAALLHRLTGNDDMAIGLPVARQSSEGLEGLVGHGVQLLPIRLSVEPEVSFQELIGRAKRATLDAREHFNFTFGSLVRDLGLSGDPSRVPLVPVIFNIDQPFGALNIGGAPATARSIPRVAENFELFLNVVPANSQLIVEATYNTDLFSAESISNWLVALESLLEDGATRPTTSVARLKLSPGLPSIYGTVNATAVDLQFTSWLEPVRRFETEQPESAAIADARGSLTYAEFGRRARQLTAALVARGVKPGDVVGLTLTRSSEMVVAVAAVHMAGAAYVPLDPSFPASRLEFMVRDSGARLLVADQDRSQAVADYGLPVVSLSDSQDPGSGSDLPPPGGDDLAYIIYTSGSTGQPKGVEVTHGAVANMLQSMSRTPGLRSSDSLLALTTLSFDISVLELLLPLVVGGRVVVGSREEASDPRALAELIARFDITAMQATPSTWRMLVRDGWSGRRSLRALCGGEPLPPDLVPALLSRVGELWNMYGPTETTVWSTCHRVTPGGPIVVGKPIDNTVVYVVDAGGDPLPPSVPGEIWIGGSGVARGYHGRADLTADRFIDHPRLGRLYRTGDRGRLHPEGVLEHLGRLDAQVKVRGFRIELGEIEAALAAHPGVEQAVVTAHEFAPGDVRLVAYCVVPGTVRVPDAELRAHLSQSLPEYMVPQFFVPLDRIPLLPNGKVDRRSLPAADGGPDQTREYVAPRSELERVIAEVMERALGVPRLSADQSFFTAGGHSLLAAQVAAQIGRQLEIQVPIRLVFEAPSVTQLASRIEALRADGGSSRWTIPRREDRARAPLSLMQQRVWFLEQLDPGRTGFNTPSAHRLRGRLDEGAFALAFAEMVRRQESLRTIIGMENGVPVQTILPQVPYDLVPAEDLRSLPPSERDEQLQKRITGLAAEVFDLSKSPLFRAHLFRLDEEEYVFFFMTHHIIWDGWSFDLLYEEMAALYEAFAAGKPSPLGNLPISYGDYAAWQRAWMQGEELAREVDYWKSRLAGNLEPLAIPADRPRPRIMSGEGATTWMSLTSQSVDGVRNLSRRLDATPFMTLLAAYVVLLHRTTNQADLIVGTPVRGRQVAEVESIMGFFVNVLPIRFHVTRDMSFLQILAHVRDSVVDALKHPDVPFEHLVRELKVARDESRSPIYQAMFSFQDGRRRVRRWGDLEHRALHVMQPGVTEDIGVWFLDMADGLVGGLSYNLDVIAPATAERLRDRYLHLLDSVLADPETAVGRLPIRVAERRQLEAWNETRQPIGDALQIDQVIASQAVRTPDRLAISSRDARCSYGELEARANSLAHALRARGARAGVLVGLCLARGPDMVVAQLAVLKSGAAYVPLDPAFPKDRLAFMASDANLAMVVSDEASAPALGWPRESTLLVDADRATIAAYPTIPVLADRDSAKPDDLAYVIYTSGSTGTPKGVRVQHRAVVNFLASMRSEPGIVADERLVAVTTLSFDIAVLELLLPLTVGAEVVIADKEVSVDGSALAQLLEASAATMMQATPSTWRLLIDAGWRGGPHFTAICGGEALPGDLAAELLNRAAAVWNMYGPTETTVWSTCWRVERPADGIRVGHPIANTTVWILDDAGALCPIGVPGEIHIGGTGVTLGYLNRPELTAERFLRDPFSAEPGARLYRTGDKGRWRADGLLEQLGRLDDQVKIRGYRVELGEIESLLRSHPDVIDAAVHLWEAKPSDVRIVACCIPKTPGALSAVSLRKHLRARLPEYMIPQHFLPIASLPLTLNGKIDRRQLPAPVVVESRIQQHELPADPTEAAIAEIWTTLVRPDRPVGRLDRFFDIGGHSLLVFEALRDIEQRLGVRLKPRPMFQDTLVEIAAACRREMGK